MKILLFGKNGQLGRELRRSLAPLGDIVALGSRECDFAESENAAQAVRSSKPDVIVNAAAYTNVDKAESEPQLAHRINADAVSVLAQEAAKTGARLVHYSTDYVFDGSGDQPWRETDEPNPINAYGRSKLAGERAVQASGCNHLIFRSSWIYAAQGHNFIRTVLRLAQEREQLSIVNDQIGAPTGAKTVAEVTVHAIQAALKQADIGGIYHLAASGEVSWHGYARHIVEQAARRGRQLKTASDKILPIASAEYKAAARRPLNSRLDTARVRRAFCIELPEWKTGVDSVIDELLAGPSVSG